MAPGARPVVSQVLTDVWMLDKLDKTGRRIRVQESAFLVRNSLVERNSRRVFIVAGDKVAPVGRDGDVHDLVDKAAEVRHNLRVSRSQSYSESSRTHPWWNCTGMGVASLLAFS